MHTAAPLLFVMIWSTGFLVGRGVGAHADPFWFLTMRFGGVALVFVALALWARVAWPRGARRIGVHLAAGALMNGLYVGPSWWAMSQGLPAGVMALIGSLQPLFTALIAVAVLHKRLSRTTWWGLALGFGGVTLVLLPRLQAVGAGSLALPVVLTGVGSILALTVGSMAQKSPGPRATCAAPARCRTGARCWCCCAWRCCWASRAGTIRRCSGATSRTRCWGCPSAAPRC